MRKNGIENGTEDNMNKAKRLTVEKFISILKMCKHKRTAIVTFNIEKHIPADKDGPEETIDIEYDMSYLGQFGVVPDVIIELRERSEKDYT